MSAVPDAVGGMLPMAMAVALSPFPIVAIVLVLGSPQSLRAGAAFATGWLFGLTALSSLLLLVTGGGAAVGLGGWLQIAGGLALLFLAWRKWHRRPRTGEAAKTPGWIAALDTISPIRAAVIGAGLGGLNPKNIGLAFAAVAPMANLGLDRREAVFCLALFTLLGSTSVLGALLARMIGGQRAAAPLDRVKQFMLANNSVILMVVLLLIGAKLLGNGIASLFG